MKHLESGSRNFGAGAADHAALNGPVGVAMVGAKARRCKKLRNVDAAALGPATPLTELRAEKEERGVLTTLDGVRCNALSPDEMHIVYGKTT